MTIAETLRDAEARLRTAGIEDARLEAEVLLAHALGLTREALFARLREQLPSDAQARFEALVSRRRAHEPTAYITGHKEFYGLDLICTPDALIPRPETETLVELALAWLRTREQGTRNKEHGYLPRPATRDPRPFIADVGTGNGAIAVALAVHLPVRGRGSADLSAQAGAPQARIVATDVSRAALRLARRNADKHRVADRIAFVQGDLLSPVRCAFDLIVANLPYVPTRLYKNLAPEIVEHEPEAALHPPRAGGTALIEALLALARERLRPGGLLLAEHAWNQGKRLREAARAAFPNARVETKRDLAGRERALVVET